MKKIRYGVIGIKGIGECHIHLARENEQAELTALVDIDAEAVNKRSEERGVRGFTDYRDLLEAGIVDAVSIATPHHLHGTIGLDCLKAGVHVFVEKPLANRVSEADAMLAAAESRSLKICVGHQYRFHRSSQVMKHLIDTGAIGNVMRVLWTWGDFRPEAYYTRDIWRGTFRYAGGGILMYHVSHDLDLICWMIGKPVQVSARVGNQLHSVQIEDVVCANVLFANGAFGSLQFTLNQPRGYSVRQIAGDKGIIVMQDVKSLSTDQNDRILLGTYEGTLPTAVTKLEGAFDQPDVSWQHVKLPGAPPLPRKLRSLLWRLGLLKRTRHIQHSVLMNSFVDSILNGGEPIVSGQNARPTVELINAMYLSALRKKMVDLPLDPEEYDQLFEELSQGKTQVPRFHQLSNCVQPL